MENNEIDKLLKEWRVDGSLPGDFNSAVWRRVENRRLFGVGEWISGLIADLFAKRAVAFSYLAVALVLGLAAGQVHASRDLQSAELEARSNYIRSVDPYSGPLAR